MALTLKEVKQCAIEWLRRELAPHGFKIRGANANRKIDGGEQEVGFGVLNRLPANSGLCFAVEIRLDAVQSMAAELGETRLTNAPTIQRQFGEFSSTLRSMEDEQYYIRFNKLDEIMEYLAVASPVVQGALIPALNRARSPKSVVEEFPITPESVANPKAAYPFAGQLALAHAAGLDWRQLAAEGKRLLESTSAWNNPDSNVRRHWETVERNAEAMLR